MEENLLNLAKKSQKEHKWKDSIIYFDKYIKEKRDTCADSVYTSYARSLRIVGNTSSAKEVLIKGKMHHPNSEHILREFHNLYDILGDWQAAKRVAKELIKLNPKHADYHFRLGRSYSFLSQYKKAKLAYQNALKLKHGIPFNELVQRIQIGFADHPSEVNSRYIFIDGKNNFGAFIHHYKGKRFFTKISKYTNKNNGASREKIFYKELCSDFPQLKRVVPQYINSQTIDNLVYLTIEVIDTITTDSSNYIEKIIEHSHKISTVTYKEFIKNYCLPDYVFQFRKGRAISVVHFFTQIHDESYNRKLFEALYLIMKQHHYPKGIQQLIHRLESTIMNNNLYSYFKPEEHYSLLHGDFSSQNVLIKKDAETPCIIDWASFTVGPHFIDLARYFTSILFPYSEVKQHYLLKDNAGKDLSLIEKIFFLYALILFYFQKLGRKGIETELSEYILPALEDLEKFVLKFTGGNQLDQEKDLQLKQLSQKVSILEEERKYLHKRLRDLENSKSWKVTAPLRLFTEGRKKN